MDPAPPQPAEQRHEPSSMSSPQGVPNMGKHRMSAAISFLNQQIQLIQDELDELETIGGVSTVCPDLVTSIDSVPDPLLPVGPIGNIYAGAEVQERLAGIGGFKEPTVLGTEGGGFDDSFV
ncbi:hypothetical protein ACS0TY_012040 [Phlomoides rotata]